MPTPRIALIHATPVAIEPIAGAFKRLWPGARTTNLLDDSLAADLARDGDLSEKMIGRFVTLARYSRDCGAHAILFTCSAFGAAIEAAAASVDLPVLKPNEAMLDEALAAGTRIGLLATFAPSLPSLKAELEQLGKAKGMTLTIRCAAIPSALAALHEGQPDEHDRLIATAAAEMEDCDALVLGQFSMASAADSIPARPAQVVLTSPASAVTRLKQILGA